MPRYIILLGIIMFSVLLPDAGAQAQTNQRCFPETGLCIEGRIREFWEQNGELLVFGFPISSQQEEQIEGKPFQAQWFERNRLELHPEKPRPYDVLLGRLGVDRLGQQGRDWLQFPKSDPQAGCRFSPETGHNICGDILRAWRASGLEFDGRRGTSEAESLALFGLPLSDPIVEDTPNGQFTVQWFERARFELHPENQPPFDVLLGLLGRELRPQESPPSPPSPLHDVFRQADGVEAFTWMYSPGSLMNQLVTDQGCRYSGSYGLQLIYGFSGEGNGGWGVHWANTPTKQFDASQFTVFTFWIKGTAPNGFHIGLKDSARKEVKLEAREIVAVSDSEWKKVAVPLNRFADSGGSVNPAAVENFSFGFSSGHGAGNICIDDMAFQ
jgi:hypothetical protein